MSKMRIQYRLALAAVISWLAAGACSSPVERPEPDTSFDATIHDDGGSTDAHDAVDLPYECETVCTPDSTCDFQVEQPEPSEFLFPPGLEPAGLEFWPVEHEDFDGANPAATSTLTTPDPRWPSDYHEGAFVPYGESFRLSMGMLPSIAQDTSGPYRVFVSAWVDYTPAPTHIAVPMPGREDFYFDDRTERATVEIPELPLVLDIEFPAEVLGDRGLRNVVIMYRISTLDRTASRTFVERFSIYYGGNERVDTHPCFVLGEPVPLTEQEERLAHTGYLFYRDEQSITEQRNGFQETVGTDQTEIELTMGASPSRAPDLAKNMTEVFFLFRNEELIFQEHVARHPQAEIDPQSYLSQRRVIAVDLPLDDDRFVVWGFAVQHPYTPELDYETGRVTPETWNQIDGAYGPKVESYRIIREP